MKVNIISFTQNGDKLNNNISALFENVNSVKRGELKNSVAQWASQCRDCIIFIGAAGIAVRSIAPIVRDKTTDPAVIVCDEKGKFVIPILSGHIGKANEIALYIAEKIKAVPVITTATDINNVWAVDVWAEKKGFYIENTQNIKYISSALLHNQKIGLHTSMKISGELPENVVISDNTECGIVTGSENIYPHTLNIYPKYTVGVGSKKNADENALVELFENMGIDNNKVAFVATIDIKKEEQSVKKLCEYLDVPLVTYTSQELNRVEGEFTSSEFVKRVTGCDNVCERAASVKGEIIIKKTAGKGVTMAIGRINTIDFK